MYRKAIYEVLQVSNWLILFSSFIYNRLYFKHLSCALHACVDSQYTGREATSCVCVNG